MSGQNLGKSLNKETVELVCVELRLPWRDMKKMIKQVSRIAWANTCFILYHKEYESLEVMGYASGLSEFVHILFLMRDELEKRRESKAKEEEGVQEEEVEDTSQACLPSSPVS